MLVFRLMILLLFFFIFQNTHRCVSCPSLPFGRHSQSMCKMHCPSSGSEGRPKVRPPPSGPRQIRLRQWRQRRRRRQQPGVGCGDRGIMCIDTQTPWYVFFFLLDVFKFSFIYLFTCLFIYLFTYLFIYSFIYWIDECFVPNLLFSPHYI